MKFLIVKTVWVTVFVTLSLTASAQKNYYVVVGAFSADGNVKEFTTQVPSFNTDSAYSYSNADNLMHFYVLKTQQEDLAVSKALQLRDNLESNTYTAGMHEYESVTVNNLSDQKTVTLKKETITNGVDSNDDLYNFGGKSSMSASGSSMGKMPLNVKGKLFKFTVTTEDGFPLPGRVHHVDLLNQQDVAVYQPEGYTTIVNPGKNKEMALVCGVFGYKQVEKYLDYSNPSMVEGAYRDEHGAWVVPYELERLEKGDVSVMYNLSFYKDAVVMLPQSKTDLDELVNMMNENPNYEITIHGHRNGKNSRKIIAMDSGQRFFETNGSMEINGSAKMLSDLRAKAIEAYLVSNGISNNRIKTYAWGGSDMLVDAESPQARLNDRIEIEIRKD